MDKFQIGISSCLLGQSVRYNGGHKHSSLVNELSSIFEYRGICPEVEIGMGTPRKPIHLARIDGDLRLVGAVDQTQDYTEAMTAYAEEKTDRLQEELDGYILMKKSPSCGLFGIKVYNEKGNMTPEKGRGMYAEQLVKTNPLLPVEEEGRLHDPVLKENFVSRVYIYRQWKEMCLQPYSVHNIQQFHQHLKYKIMSHSQTEQKNLGVLLANAHKQDLQQVYTEYIHKVMEVVAKPVKRRNVYNVLQHIYGHVKKSMDGYEKDFVLEQMDDYRQGVLPLVSVMRLMKFLAHKYNCQYILEQSLFDLYPKKLCLHNHI